MPLFGKKKNKKKNDDDLYQPKPVVMQRTWGTKTANTQNNKPK